MEKRLEMRNNEVWLVIGAERSRARVSLMERLKDSNALEWQGYWESLRNPKNEYRIRPAFGFEALPAKTYCYHLGIVLESVLAYNESEKAAELVSLETEIIEVDERVEKFYWRLKEKLETIRRRCIARSKAFAEDRMQLERAYQEYNSEIIWREHSRVELRNSIQCGTLAETAETKTLYEMFDDGKL